MTLEFLPEASAELYEAADYYEGKQPGLGWRFRSEVLELCRLIVQQPLLWRERPGGYRRVNCLASRELPHSRRARCAGSVLSMHVGQRLGNV